MALSGFREQEWLWRPVYSPEVSYLVPCGDHQTGIQVQRCMSHLETGNTLLLRSIECTNIHL